MAIAFDAKSTGSSDPSTSVLSWSHTVGTGDNRLLVVTVGESRNVDIISVDYNATQLTKAFEKDAGSQSADVWYLNAPATGSNTVNVNYAAALTVPRAGAASFTNAIQDSEVVGATSSISGTAQSKSIGITTESDGSVIIDVIGAGGGIHTPTAGQTVINTDGNNRIGGYEVVGSAGSYTQTWDSTNSQPYAMIATEFKGIAGGGATPKRLSLLGVGQ